MEAKPQSRTLDLREAHDQCMDLVHRFSILRISGLRQTIPKTKAERRKWAPGCLLLLCELDEQRGAAVSAIAPVRGAFAAAMPGACNLFDEYAESYHALSIKIATNALFVTECVLGGIKDYGAQIARLADRAARVHKLLGIPNDWRPDAIEAELIYRICERGDTATSAARAGRRGVGRGSR